MEKIWNALKEFAWPFGLCGGALAIITRFTPNASVSLNLLITVISIFLAVIITLIGYVARKPKDIHQQVEVEQVIDSGKLFLLKKTDAVGMSMAALIFYKEGSHERLIAHGVIINIQTNGMPQLEVKYLPSVEGALFQEISEGKPAIRERLIVKPGIALQAPISEVENEGSV